MSDYVEDIAALAGLLILSAGICILFNFGWALVALGSGLFGSAILVAWKGSPHAASPIEHDDDPTPQGREH